MIPRVQGALLAATLAAVLAAAGLARAANAEVRVEVSSREIPSNGSVRVTVYVEGPDAQEARIEGRAPRGHKLLPAGGFSTSSQVSWINGRVSASRSFSVDYVPAGLGDAEIPSFEVRLGNETIRTKPIAVKIVEAGSGSSPGSATGDRAAGGREPDARVDVTARLSRRRVFLGEAVRLEYVLRARERVAGYEPERLEPVPGFLVEDETVDVRNTRRTVEGDDGIEWVEFVLFRRYLTPTRSGTLEIPAVPFRVGVERRERDTFGISLFPRTVMVSRVAPALRVEVAALPDAGRPDDFSGAVGRFKLDVRLAPDRTSVGQAVNLEATVEGTGSLATAEPPRIEVPADVQLYPPLERETSRRRRKWIFPLVVRATGQVRIPEIRFSYFDSGAESYQTLTAGPMTLEVTGGQAPLVDEALGQAAPVRAQATDLQFIQPAPSRLRRSSDAPGESPLWKLAALLPLVAAPLLVFGERAWVRYSGSVSGRRARERRASSAHLARARKSLSLHAGDAPPEAARELLRGLHRWASVLLGEPSRPLERAQLRARLARATGADELADRLVDLIDRAEAARYGSSGGEHHLRQLVADAQRWLDEASR